MKNKGLYLALCMIIGASIGILVESIRANKEAGRRIIR